MNYLVMIGKFPESGCGVKFMMKVKLYFMEADGGKNFISMMVLVVIVQ